MNESRVASFSYNLYLICCDQRLGSLQPGAAFTHGLYFHLPPPPSPGQGQVQGEDRNQLTRLMGSIIFHAVTEGPGDFWFEMCTKGTASGVKVQSLVAAHLLIRGSLRPDRQWVRQGKAGQSWPVLKFGKLERQATIPDVSGPSRSQLMLSYQPSVPGQTPKENVGKYRSLTPCPATHPALHTSSATTAWPLWQRVGCQDSGEWPFVPKASQTWGQRQNWPRPQ